MRKEHVITLAVAAVAAMSLAGCGSSSEDSFREGFAAAQASQSAAAQPTPTTSTSAPVQQLQIPELDGKNGAIALDELKRAGFTNVQPATEDENDRVVLNPANWEVTKVEPSPGDTVPSDSTVVVTMTKQ